VLSINKDRVNLGAYMARIFGVDLPKGKAVVFALREIYGVGPTLSKRVIQVTEIDGDKKVELLSSEDIQKLRKELEKYTIEGDLRREIGLNIKRLKDMGCYRGVRHKKSLPVRGQRTHTNARTRKGKAVAIAGKKSIKQLK
jgi:small subunit ribosomal protein S13